MTVLTTMSRQPIMLHLLAEPHFFKAAECPNIAGSRVIQSSPITIRQQFSTSANSARQDDQKFVHK